jgi:hypothetical protein
MAFAAAAIILGFFVVFAGDGIFAYFAPDDMMNLYDAWLRPLQAQRPVGVLFHRAIFAAFGLNPLPYRIGCYLLLLANLALLYLFCLRLSRSREVAAIACLLGAYHAHLADLYYTTSTVYDLLCFCFFLTAFLCYAAYRERGPIAWPQGLLIFLLYACALGAKEMAVSLPVLILAYEFPYHPRDKRDLRLGAACTLITAALVAYKIFGERKVDIPDFHPHIAWSALMDSWKHYTFDLFYGAMRWTNAKIVILWLLLAAIAWLSRRRDLRIAFVLLFAGILPVAFIPIRGFYAVYLTLPGWYLFFAVLIAATRRPVAAFMVLALILAPLHYRQKPRGNAWVAEAEGSVRSALEPMDRVVGKLPRGARVLFLADPFPKDDWILTFMFRLHYRDEDIRVDRAVSMRAPPDLASYDCLLRLEGGRLTLETR